jgi:hypothetical protein
MRLAGNMIVVWTFELLVEGGFVADLPDCFTQEPFAFP